MKKSNCIEAFTPTNEKNLELDLAQINKDIKQNIKKSYKNVTSAN